ncbi:MFS transporter [Candidatus Berkiella aquae]|nr:MFS transporter [Candidatus Berkiella aquae]
MTLTELKSTLILSLVFALRMLGLFMVLPVLALYAQKIPGATPALIGLAAGIYGFSQALLQLPCGVLSDRWGRKPVIIGGLSIFALGSMVAAFSGSIGGLILGRAIQGAGAIGSPILALVTDVTREEVRTRAMALIGITIGLTFTLAILLGPIFDAYIGLQGIFTLTAILAVVGIGLLCLLKPHKPVSPVALSLREQLRLITQQGQLWALHISIFMLHAVLIASFLVLPSKIEAVTGFISDQVWRFYLPVLLASLLLVTPLLRIADKGDWQRRLLPVAVLGLGVTIFAFMNTTQVGLFTIAVVLFFVAFNFLEACLPSMVSKVAPKESKGSALGMYSCAQFLGMFCGGALGGRVLQQFGAQGVSITCLLLISIGWVAIQQFKSNNLGVKNG